MLIFRVFLSWNFIFSSLFRTWTEHVEIFLWVFYMKTYAFANSLLVKSFEMFFFLSLVRHTYRLFNQLFNFRLVSIGLQRSNDWNCRFVSVVSPLKHWNCIAKLTITSSNETVAQFIKSSLIQSVKHLYSLWIRSIKQGALALNLFHTRNSSQKKKIEFFI